MPQEAIPCRGVEPKRLAQEKISPPRKFKFLKFWFKFKKIHFKFQKLEVKLKFQKFGVKLKK